MNTGRWLAPRFLVGSLVVLGVLLGLALVLAPEARAATPCCGITAMDVRTGLVTARETATGRAFQFQVKDASLLKSLRVGQNISADLKGMSVTLPAAKPGAKAVRLRMVSGPKI